MATLIRVDGSSEQVQPANGAVFTLAELQGYVGGFIQLVGLPSGGLMVLNEEGKVHGLPFNDRATVMARAAGILPDDYIVGDVLIVRSAEID